MLFLARKIIEHIELNGRLSSKPCFDDTRGSVGSEVNPTALTGGTTGGTTWLWLRQVTSWKCRRFSSLLLFHSYSHGASAGSKRSRYLLPGKASSVCICNVPPCLLHVCQIKPCVSCVLCVLCVNTQYTHNVYKYMCVCTYIYIYIYIMIDIEWYQCLGISILILIHWYLNWHRYMPIPTCQYTCMRRQYCMRFPFLKSIFISISFLQTSQTDILQVKHPQHIGMVEWPPPPSAARRTPNRTRAIAMMPKSGRWKGKSQVRRAGGGATVAMVKKIYERCHWRMRRDEWDECAKLCKQPSNGRAPEATQLSRSSHPPEPKCDWEWRFMERMASYQ